MKAVAWSGPIQQHETVVVDAELIGVHAEQIESERHRHIGRAVVVQAERSARGGDIDELEVFNYGEIPGQHVCRLRFRSDHLRLGRCNQPVKAETLPGYRTEVIPRENRRVFRLSRNQWNPSGVLPVFVTV